ncbi:MAG: DUF2007 domain-containing protein [Verrucomicrobiota bacterium]
MRRGERRNEHRTTVMRRAEDCPPDPEQVTRCHPALELEFCRLEFCVLRCDVPSMEFVTVYTTLDRGDAELIRGRLESADFTVNVKNEDVIPGLAAGGVLLQVPEEEAEEARALLKYQDSSDS